MNRPDLPGALALLGLGDGATEEGVRQAHRRQVREAQRRASNAPQQDVREQYERRLEQLDAARDVVLEHLRSLGPLTGPGFYGVVGLPITASREQLEQRLRQEVRKAQQRQASGARAEDRHAAGQRLQALAETRRVLLDDELRAQHDRDLARGGAPAPAAGGPERPAEPDPPAGPPALSDGERLTLAEERFGAGAYPEVLDLLHDLSEAGRQAPGAARLFGLAAWRSGQAAAAVNALTQARAEHPEDPEVAAALVESHVERGQTGTVAAVARTAVEQDASPQRAVSRAVLQALSARAAPDLAVEIAESALLRRRDDPASAACLVDAVLSAADAYRTQLRDGRLVLTSVGQCERVAPLAALLRDLPTDDPEVQRRVRRLRVQLLDARRTHRWNGGPRWAVQPVPAVLVARGGAE